MGRAIRSKGVISKRARALLNGRPMKRSAAVSSVIAVVGAVFGLGGIAWADVVVHVEAPPPARDEAAAYPFELEPHFTFGPENVYGNAGFGAGLRAGLPLLTGHLGEVPDNLALSVGGDMVHYDNCFYSGDCGANYLLVPVAAQWNVFVARQFSVFGEAGLYMYKGWFAGCGPDDVGCSTPSEFGVLPTIAIGGRFHFADMAALTLRLGYPTTTIGVSFM
jgi:hypothetical protein